jgi:hypothetical protein
MGYTVKCDVMSDGWNYDNCFECKNFSTARTIKGRTFRCKLNSDTAKEKRDFYIIWGNEFLRNYGIDLSENQITVEYVGKKKRKPK